MIIVGAPVGANFVGIAHLGTDSLKEPALKPSAENVSHYLQGGKILIAKLSSQLPNCKKRLSDVRLHRQINAGGRLLADLGKRGHGRLLDGPTGKCLFELSLH